MGKKKLATTTEENIKETDVVVSEPVAKVSSKRRVDSGVLYIESTYNNTKLTLTDSKSNVLAWSSSGTLGFKGAKKGTPFAAAKVGETLAAKAQTLGIKEDRVVVNRNLNLAKSSQRSRKPAFHTR